MKPIPFDEDLERNWPGAEGWPDSSPPLYISGTFANGDMYELIFDKNGAHLYAENPAGTALHLLRNFANQREALAFAENLKTAKTQADFARAGFVPDSAER